MFCSDKALSTSRRFTCRLAALLVLCLTTITTASAEPVVRCLWTPARAGRMAAPPGVARVQYTQLFDDKLAALLPRALGPDRTLRFHYEKDWPDGHVFPNGVTMGRIHQWLASL